MADHRSHLRARSGSLIILLSVFAIALSILPTALATSSANAALNGTVAFDDTIRALSSESMKAVWPWVAVDSNNHSHIVYTDSDNGNLFYINNINGNFSTPVRVDVISDGKEPLFALAAGPNNVLHLVYASGRGDSATVYHRRGFIQGNRVDWPRSDRVDVSGGGKSVNPHLTVDGAGTAHLVWINKACGEYTVAYRFRRADGSMNSISRPAGSSCPYQNRPQIAITNDGQVHIAYQSGKDISYSRREGSRWATQNISRDGSSNSANASIATDGVGLYVIWGEGITSGNHDIRFRYSADGGRNWSTVTAISNTPQFAQFPNITFSKAANRAYMVWSDRTGAVDNFGDIYFREFDPVSKITGAADRILRRAEESGLPVIATGPNVVDIVWQDKAGDRTFSVYETAGRIVGSGPAPTPVPVACDATVSTAPQTNAETVTLAITPAAGCTPTQMQVSVDTPPTDATPKVPFAPNPVVPVPTADACGRAFYVRLFDAAGNAGNIASTTSIVDRTVNAALVVSNPNTPASRGLLSMQDVSSNGASNGDPAYARVKQLYVEVLPVSDCVGLKSIQIEQAPPVTIPPGGLRTILAVPSFDNGPGSYDIPFRITDQLDNVLTVSRRFVYDPPVVNNDPVGLPVYSRGTVTGPVTTTTVLTTLTFNNVIVDDSRYGNSADLPTLPSGQRFWGVWVASSRSATATDDQLNWSPVATPSRQCDGGGCNFSVPWSLFTGLGFNPADPDRAGEYYVYVKFLDGAGNATTQTIRSEAITLQPGYATPRQFFPYVWR